jgi:hypothetical protein
MQAKPLFLRLYGAAAGAALLFAVLIFFFGAPHSRESLAVTSSTIWIGLAVLMTGYFYSQALTAAGAKPWVARLVLAPFVLSPAGFVLLMPRWGPAALALTCLVFYLIAQEGKPGEHAR